MKLLGFALGALQTNCYILVCEKTSQAAVFFFRHQGYFIDPWTRRSYRCSGAIASYNESPSVYTFIRCEYDY